MIEVLGKMNVVLNSYIILFLLQIISSCSERKTEVFEKDDFWIKNYWDGAYPSKTILRDNIYCSSLHSDSKNSPKLYCFNLSSGRVEWATEVKSWATRKPIVANRYIYYSGYLGDIYKLDYNGKAQWNTEIRGSFADHTINPLNNNLFVSTVENGVFELDFDTGEVVSHYYPKSLGATLPVFYQNYMIMAGNSKDDTTISYNLSCYDISKKVEKWKVKTLSIKRPLYQEGGRIYFVDENSVLNCVSALHGSIIWRTKNLVNHKVFTTFPSIIFLEDNLIVYGSEIINMVEVSKKTGIIIRKLDYKQLFKEKIIVPKTENYFVKTEKQDYSIQLRDSLGSISVQVSEVDN